MWSARQTACIPYCEWLWRVYTNPDDSDLSLYKCIIRTSIKEEFAVFGDGPLGGILRLGGGGSSDYTICNLSQKSLATLRRKPSPASPLSMLLQWCRLFFRYFLNLQNNIGQGVWGKRKPLSNVIVWDQSQPKVSGHPQTTALPRFPSFNVATMMSTFLSIFFWTCKTTLGRGYGGKGSHCPMLLSEIVWKSYVRYVVSFYVMLISTLLQSHVRARPVQRWRCTILNKIITAATAVKLHGNRCSLNHVDMNL